MGQDSKIQWTHHSWSPWRGCTKVSPGCANCYAESLSKRNPAVLGEWGPNGRRSLPARAAWDSLTKWDRAAARAGERHRVFPSLCDPFEDRDDLIGPRNQFFSAIHTTPNLIYLLLTKRPENIARLWPPSYPKADHPSWGGRIWLGTSVEDQQRADERIPALLQIPAAVRFLSVEPLIGPIDLSRYLGFQHEDEIGIENRDQSLPREQGIPFHDPWVRGIDWAIVGGESGPNARPCNLAWIRSIRDQCKAAGVACFVKQLGAHWISEGPDWNRDRRCPGWSRHDPKGGDPDEWPDDLRIREFPRVPAEAAP